MAQRFPKLTPEQMTPAQREVAAEITAGPRREVRGPFIALIHNPELARRLQKLGEHLREGCKALPEPNVLDIFDYVYAEGSPEIDAQRDGFAAYLDSFETAGGHR